MKFFIVIDLNVWSVILSIKPKTFQIPYLYYYKSITTLVFCCFIRGKFSKPQKEVALQGRKCMFNIVKICKNLCLNIETKVKVFDTYVTSVLNYGCKSVGMSLR